MTDNIIARFEADISDYKAKLIDLENQLKKISAGEEKVGDTALKANKEVLTASQKRKQALKLEEEELKKLQAALKGAFTVPEISKFNSQIAQTKNNITLLKGEATEVNKAIGSLSSSFADIGKGIVAAFSVDAIIQFGKASVQAFREAEVNANKLKFAIANIANESSKSFDKLIKQSEELQKISIFSDDDIQRAQTQLIQLGLTGSEVEKLIPKILDLAAATGKTLSEATDTVIQGINGQTRALKPLGLEFKNTGDKAENLAIITQKIAKYQGAATEALNTSAGAAENFKNKIDDLQESIGGRLSPAIDNARYALLQLVDVLINSPLKLINILSGSFTGLENAADDAIKKNMELLTSLGFVASGTKEEIKTSIKTLNTLINSLNKEDKALQKTGEGEKDKKKRQELINTAYEKQIGLIKAQIILQDRSTNMGVVKTNILGKALQKLIETQLELNKVSNLGLTDEEKARRQAEADRKAAKLKEDAAKRQAELDTIVAGNELKKRQQVIDIIGEEQKQIAKKVEDNDKLVQDSADKQVEINNEKNRKIAQADRDARAKELEAIKKSEEEKNQISQEITNTTIEASKALADAIISIQRDRYDREAEQQIAALEKEKDRATSSKRLTESEKEKIVALYVQREEKIKKDKFEKDKRFAEEEATINAALAIIKIFAGEGNIYVKIAQAALVTALTAAEIAKIDATKYAKGTKKAKDGMALVGEEGPEFMYVPGGAKILTAQQTDKHSKLIDAIYDNRLEKMLYQDYVLPALEKKKQDFAKIKASEFADNISRSLIFQGLTGTDMEQIRRKGTQITNAKEIAQELAIILEKSYNRRKQI